MKEAALAATQAAAEASQHAATAQSASANAGDGGVSSEVLDRLEEDYKLIASLVRELYARSAALTAEPVAPSSAGRRSAGSRAGSNAGA